MAPGEWRVDHVAEVKEICAVGVRKEGGEVGASKMCRRKTFQVGEVGWRCRRGLGGSSTTTWRPDFTYVDWVVTISEG